MRKYKYNNRWLDFTALHFRYGFTKYPTATTQGYKSANSSSWGTVIYNLGYLDKHESVDIEDWEFFVPDDGGWTSLNGLLTGYELYPYDGIDTILMSQSRSSKTILYLADIGGGSVELWYLIKNDLTIGWIQDSDLSSHGWYPSTLPTIESYSEVPLATVRNNESIVTNLPYSFSKLYSYMVIPNGTGTVQYDGWEIERDPYSTCVKLINKTGEDVYIVCILFKVIKKENIDTVNIQSTTTGDIVEAYRYDNNGTYWYTPVWFDLDWVTDLSDLGYILLPKVTHKIGYLVPSQTPVVDLPSGDEQPLCDFNSDQLYYDSSIFYESVRYYDSSNGLQYIISL